MFRRFHARALLLLFVVGLTCTQVRAAEELDELARDVDRLISLRQVKDLQRSYAHYAQFGLWDEMANLFTADAKLIRGSETISGRAAIAEWLMQRGGGRRGLA
ncbi:MAG TPA: nuclear transport factor 2 family protein, partial [Steroidobacteraceae bacterium]